MVEISLQPIWEAIQQIMVDVTTEVNSHLDLQIGTVHAGLKDIQHTLNSQTGQIIKLQQRVNMNEDNVDN